MAYVIAEPCIGVKDTACVDAYPVDCIHPKKDTLYEDGRPDFNDVEQLYIDPVECIDCGACVPVCPVAAIFAVDDLPEKWHAFTEINANIVQLEQETGCLLKEHQDAVQRLAEVPGLGVDSAQQIIAEVGAKAATFPSPKALSSWVGACPGDEESVGESKSHRFPKGNRHMRRILNQCANAAVKTKGSIFETVYRRLVVRLGHKQTIGAIAHRLCRLIWIILHREVRYEERGPAVNQKSKQRRTASMIRQLRRLGYQVQLRNPQPA
jgi:NAD-dependent dihydropyrimidine dehydrogenase PreA subunit